MILLKWMQLKFYRRSSGPGLAARPVNGFLLGSIFRGQFGRARSGWRYKNQKSSSGKAD